MPRLRAGHPYPGSVRKGIAVSVNVRNINFYLYERKYSGIYCSLEAFVKVYSCERMVHDRKQQNILLRQGLDP